MSLHISTKMKIKYLLVTSIRNGLKLVKARDFQNLMGRTARAGIYTEGSIIITDCKIYDNRTNWKNGGRYLWNDCVKLFDIKLTEPCGSSILALVQDFNIDYDVTISGEKFIDIVIDHLDERDFLLDYAKKLEKAYLKANPKRTQNLIVQEILLRQDIISNIENYLCLVRSAETLVNDSKKSAVDICTNTLAYAMATEKEKELLIKVFQKIEENIQQYSVEKLSRYSNAMSGIGLSSLIEEWIVQNELTEKIYTETELLYVITELYLQICGDFRYQEHIQSISCTCYLFTIIKNEKGQITYHLFVCMICIAVIFSIILKQEILFETSMLWGWVAFYFFSLVLLGKTIWNYLKHEKMIGELAWNLQ